MVARPVEVTAEGVAAMEATAGEVAEEAAENERSRGRSQRRAGMETDRPDANFGRIRAAICLAGVAVIMYAPRPE
ncbi:hypothetical protein FMUBM48_55060 [Nocardia cyriacigeorgica]|nr:hypothetical protein FMUBM48_55060 [Nocardia cyriacigeorgica]